MKQNTGKILTLFEIKRLAIKEALTRNEGNRTRTARELGISIRCLRNWIAGRNKHCNLGMADANKSSGGKQ